MRGPIRGSERERLRPAIRVRRPDLPDHDFGGRTRAAKQHVLRGAQPESRLRGLQDRGEPVERPESVLHDHHHRRSRAEHPCSTGCGPGGSGVLSPQERESVIAHFRCSKRPPMAAVFLRRPRFAR